MNRYYLKLAFACGCCLLVFLVGCIHNNNPILEELQEHEGIFGQVMEIQEDKMRLIENIGPHEGYTQFGMNIALPEEEWTSIYFNESTVVEIIDGDDIKNLNKSKGTIHDFSEGDIIIVLGENESDQFFADKIVIIRYLY